MATQTIVAENQTLTAEQQARAAEFAKKERQRAESADGAELALASVSGLGTTTYNVTMLDNGSGVAWLSWSVSNTHGAYVIADNDWIGVFTNTNQALSDPNANYLGGSSGWQWASKGGSYLTKVKLQPGLVAAYVTKNADGKYKTVAVTAPYPLG